MNTKAKAIAHRLIGHAFTLMPAAIAAYAVVGLASGFAGHVATQNWNTYAGAHHCVLTQPPVDFDQPATWACDASPANPDAFALIGIRVQK
jgi:hypothetical protein